MGIGGVTSAGSMQTMQMTSANKTDAKSKSIQKELSDVQQQLQKLSSDGTLSVNEKSNKRKQLQKEKSDLNTELKQHQEELARSQKRERMLAELRKEQGTAKKADPDGKAQDVQPQEDASDGQLQAKETSFDQTDEKKLPIGEAQPGTVINQSSDGTVIFKGTLSQTENTGTDTAEEMSDISDGTEKHITAEEETKPAEDGMAAETGFSDREVHAMVSADTTARQADRLGTIVSKTNDGIAILKGEIAQDERRGVDTEGKQAELEKMEKQEEIAAAFQFSVLGGAGNAMKTAVETNAAGTEDRTGNVENNAYISAMNATQEEQAQERFHVAIT